MKRTYQPSKTRRNRTHGFLVRMKSRGGRSVINARRAKGRARLSVWFLISYLELRDCVGAPTILGVSNLGYEADTLFYFQEKVARR